MSTQESGTGNPVAEHYNHIKEKGRADREKSKIFHLRSFNNWVKSVLICRCVRQLGKRGKDLSVLELGCGKGGDAMKWKRYNPGRLAFVDFSDMSMKECQNRYESSQKNMPAADDCKVTFDVRDICEDFSDLFDAEEFNLISCQFVVHYLFSSFERVEGLLKNVARCLKPGGLFFGTTTDCFEMVRRWQIERDVSESNIVQNGVYSIDFGDVSFPPPLFGAKVDFKLYDLIDCPEYLIYFPAFKRLADDFGLRIIYCKNFKDFFSENHVKERRLLSKMQALKCYPLEEDGEKDCTNLSYEHAEKVYRRLNKRGALLGTLSKEEWEAATIYVCFIFQKR